MTVTWIEADIISVKLPPHGYDVWHDRAVFHFLAQPEERRCYVETLRQALRPEGYAIVATFALDGPMRCSGLNAVRYGPASLADEFGAEFDLVRIEREIHRTPLGAEQAFQYCTFRKRFQGADLQSRHPNSDRE